MKKTVGLAFLWVTILTVLGVGVPLAQVIKIGAEMPLTGYATAYGEDAKRGVELAVDEANAAGGIRGKKVEVIFEDDGGIGKMGVAATQKLITVDKVPVIIGGMMSAATLPAAPICRENKVALIATIMSHPELTSPGGYIYRIANSDVVISNVEAKFVYNVLKLRKAAGLVAQTEHGTRVQKGAKERFEKLGGLWLSSDTFPQGTSDFRTQLTKLKDRNPEALFVVATHKEGAAMLRQMVELAVKPVVVATGMFDDPNIVELAGKASEGVYFSVEAAISEEVKKKEREFVEKFQAKFGKKPAIMAKRYYDATMLALHAIKTGGETGPEIDKALARTKDLVGVTGIITFNEIGDRINPMTLRKIEGGKFVETQYIDMGD